ncbi:response regulator [Planctomycetota bacterium]|nr:response regulator [Planctomycetota bacterium]
MTHQAKTAKARGTKIRSEKKVVNLLLVDPDHSLVQAISQFEDQRIAVKTKHVSSLTEARQLVLCGQYDLAIVELNLPDGSGIDFIEELNRDKHAIQSALVAKDPTVDQVITSMRIGITDILKRPLDDKDINRCMQAMLAKQSKHQDHTGRVERLRRLCKKLNQARQDVSQQVDVLCNDLVMAYQELACQMQQVVQTSEYSAIIRDELDLEVLLRTTLEHVIEKVGPTNAAIFLPSAVDEYSLGGYVNYDCTADSADMLLQHLADVVAPKVATREDLLHITDNDTLNYWIGDDAAYLADSHVVAVPCRDEHGETLAVFILFRDCNEPFEDASVEASNAIGPLLAEALARVIRVHHRSAPEGEDWGGENDDYEDWDIDLGFSDDRDFDDEE